ncbi:MAG: hypothetical protein LBD24_09070, partial [Spirochaetaceae bacterium]|nr:hypothetical protein [Spirochaetaceae bacterium]
GIPFVVKGIPDAVKGIPFVVKGIPFVVKGIPDVPKGIPFVVKGIPDVPKGIPFKPKPALRGAEPSLITLYTVIHNNRRRTLMEPSETATVP